MKHIIIAGIARTEKTTVCKELTKKGYFNHWTCDSLFYAFEKVFPEHGINQEETIQGVKKASKNFVTFFNTVMNAVYFEYLEYPTLFDIYQLTPEDYIKCMNKDLADIYFLGYPNITVEEEFKILRQNQEKGEYTRKYTDAYLTQLIKQRIQESKELEKQCKKYNLRFIDTSYNRKEKIKQLVEEIEENSSKRIRWE